MDLGSKMLDEENKVFVRSLVREVPRPILDYKSKELRNSATERFSIHLLGRLLWAFGLAQAAIPWRL